jgi:hypothetical protein
MHIPIKYKKLYVIILMDSQWFEALFEVGYDDVMNNVADYVNFGYFVDNDGDSSGDDNSNNDENDDNDSNKEGGLFWKKRV